MLFEIIRAIIRGQGFWMILWMIDPKEPVMQGYSCHRGIEEVPFCLFCTTDHKGLIEYGLVDDVYPNPYYKGETSFEERCDWLEDHVWSSKEAMAKQPVDGEVPSEVVVAFDLLMENIRNEHPHQHRLFGEPMPPLFKEVNFD